MIICIKSNNLETLEQQLSFIGANLYGDHDIHVYNSTYEFKGVKKFGESDVNKVIGSEDSFIKKVEFNEDRHLLHDLNFYTSKKRSEQNWVFLLNENEHLSSLLTQQLPI